MGTAFDRGNILYRRKRFDPALREYEQELAEQPQSARTHVMVSLCQSNLGHYREARVSAERAIALDPQYPRGYFALAVVFFNDKRFKSQRAGDVPPMKLGIEKIPYRRNMAAAAVAEALRLAPRSMESLALKSMIAFESGRVHEALEAANEGLAINAHSIACHQLRASAFRMIGDTAAAQLAAREALSLDPNCAAVQCEVGWTALFAGRRDEARQHFMEAVRIDPTSPRIRRSLLFALRSRILFYRPFVWLLLRAVMVVHRPATRIVFIGAWLAAVVVVALTVVPRVAADDSFPGDSGFVLQWAKNWIALPVLACIALHCLANYILLFDVVGRSVMSRAGCIVSTVVSGAAVTVVIGLACSWLGWIGRRTVAMEAGLLAASCAMLASAAFVYGRRRRFRPGA